MKPSVKPMLDKQNLVYLVSPCNFEEVVFAEERPILLLCMPRDEEFDGQLRLLSNVALRGSNRVKGAYLEEEAVAPFRKQYAIRGTPTYLLIRNGKEVSRFIGLATEETLMRFIESELDEQVHDK